MSSQDSVETSKADTEEYQPITRLAFVQTPHTESHIVVVRNEQPTNTEAQIEPAAGDQKPATTNH